MHLEADYLFTGPKEQRGDAVAVQVLAPPLVAVEAKVRRPVAAAPAPRAQRQLRARHEAAAMVLELEAAPRENPAPSSQTRRRRKKQTEKTARFLLRL